MNKQLFLLFLTCVFILTGCYRQANDTFIQVDSQSLYPTPTSIYVSTQTPIDLNETECYNAPMAGLVPISINDNGKVAYTNSKGQLFIYTKSMLERCNL